MKASKFRMILYAFSCVLLFVGFEESDHEVIAREGQPIAAVDSLYYIGHASIKIKTAQGKIIYIDPFQPGDYSDSADVVLVTHQHNDHNRVNLVRQKPSTTVISNVQAIQNGAYQSFTIGDIKIDAVAAYNANHQKSACVGYVVEMNGVKLYHAGDTGVISEMADLAAREITYALLPIDGVFTISPEQATQAAAMINASYNVPMHTMPTPDTFNEANVARFTPPNKIVVRPGETIALTAAPTSVDDSPEQMSGFALNANYPNPFNPTTRISYSIPKEMKVVLKVYDVLGRERAELVNDRRSAGKHEVTFDARHLSSGIYFYTMQAGSFTETEKCILMR